MNFPKKSIEFLFFVVSVSTSLGSNGLIGKQQPATMLQVLPTQTGLSITPGGPFTADPSVVSSAYVLTSSASAVTAGGLPVTQMGQFITQSGAMVS